MSRTSRAVIVAVTALVVALSSSTVATAEDTYYRVNTNPGHGLNVRTGPGEQYPVLKTLPRGVMVPILCTEYDAQGRLWDKIQEPNSWVLDSYVYTGRSQPVAGRCGHTSEPAPDGFVHQNVPAWVLALRWLTDQGGRYWFTDGDEMTEQLRGHDPWLREITRQIEANELPFTGRLSKSLMDPAEFYRAVWRDPDNLWRFLKGEDMGDEAAVTFLGSYWMDYRVERLDDGKVRVTYDIHNKTTGESFTRIPPVCYWLDCPVPDRLDHPMQEQWVHMTHEFTAVYPLSCEVSGLRCPPEQRPI